jgi:hypothetical protein
MVPENLNPGPDAHRIRNHPDRLDFDPMVFRQKRFMQIAPESKFVVSNIVDGQVRPPIPIPVPLYGHMRIGVIRRKNAVRSPLHGIPTGCTAVDEQRVFLKRNAQVVFRDEQVPVPIVVEVKPATAPHVPVV